MDYTSIQRNRPLPRATQPGCFVGCQLQDSLHYCLDSINNIPYTTAIDTAGCCSQVNDAAKQLQFCVAKRCTELSDSIQSATSHCKFQTAVPDATPSQSNNPITASPVQQPPPTTPASQPTTPSGSPSAAEPPSGAPTTMYPESSSVTLSRPDRLDTSTLPVIGIPSSSATWAQVPGAATVETAQAANGAGNTYHTFTSWYTGLAKPTITNTGFRAAQHGTHFPFAAIASAVGGAVLFFALLTALYLYVRRLKRRRASAQSTISQKSAIILGVDEAPNSSSEMLYTQCALGDSTKRTETHREFPLSRTEPTHNLHQDVLFLARCRSSVEDKPLLRHGTTSWSSLSSTLHPSTGEGIEHWDDSHLRPLCTDSSHILPTTNGFVRGTERNSCGSDEDSEGPVLATSEASSTVTGWHPNRMVRPPSSIYDMGSVLENNGASPELVTHDRDIGGTGVAL